MNFSYDLSLIMRLDKQSSNVITSRYPDRRVGSEAVVIGEHAEMSDPRATSERFYVVRFAVNLDRCRNGVHNLCMLTSTRIQIVET